MGHRYIPQHYLNGFTSSANNKVWVFEKNGPVKFDAYVKKIAQRHNYYSPEVEIYLNEKIEIPANTVINKIRNRDQINQADKEKLATYMVAMLKRVPQSKIRMNSMAPGVAQELQVEWDKSINDLIKEDPARAEILEKRRSEIKANLEKYSQNPPKDFWLSLIPPERTPNVINVLQQMTWHFFAYDEAPVFLTCDNPVFYFTWMGIGKPESEVTFPISSNIVLWATSRKQIEGQYTDTKRQVIKEINRRTALNATRFVYHAKDEYWVQNFICRRHQLNRLI